MIKLPLSYALINGVAYFDIAPWGVYGAVFSTLLGDSVMLILLYGYIRGKAIFKLDLSHFSFSYELLRRFLRIGIPTALMIVIDVIAFMAISILALPLGSIVIASHQVVASICSMLYILPAAFSVAFSLMLSEKNWRSTETSCFALVKKGLSAYLYFCRHFMQCITASSR